MTTPRRFVALDLLRGATVAAMIVVNHPGNWDAVHPWLQHAAWNGWTPADLVFPFFIVIMGVAMALTAKQEATPTIAFKHVLTRAALLCAFGLLLNVAIAWPDLSSVRLPGVLQRIAATYVVTAIIMSRCRPAAQTMVAAALLLAHWGLLMLLPVDGLPAGTLTPEHNVAAWIDRAVFGRHLLTPTGDPEGLLGLLPSVSTALFGVHIGRWIRTRATDAPLFGGLLWRGIAFAVIGLLWGTFWPINKALWSGSFALFPTGMALIALALCDGALRAQPVLSRLLTPFEWLGVNALAIYIASEAIGTVLERPLFAAGESWHSGKDIVFWQKLAPLVGDYGGQASSMLYAVGYLLVWMAVAGILFRYDARLRV